MIFNFNFQILQHLKVINQFIIDKIEIIKYHIITMAVKFIFITIITT